MYTESQDSEIFVASTGFNNILDEPYCMSGIQIHNLMLKVAHKSDKNICNFGQNIVPKIVENLLLDIFDQAPVNEKNIITRDSLKQITKLDQYTTLDKQMCGVKILG